MKKRCLSIILSSFCLFRRHRYATEKRNLEKEAELEKQHLLERSVLRQTMINKHKSLMAENTRKTQEMTEKWKETQKVKKNRQIRDLQFELALTQMEELQRLKQKQIHERQEKDGIVQFERNMKKLGITSNESNGGMSISYETTEAYESRIKQLANQTMPTSEEVNNFKEQLKERTAANRLARYEKARRRRRALVQGDKEGNEDVAGTVNETEA